MKNKFKVGQVIKFKNIHGAWQYERIFAIGKYERHKGTSHIRVTHQGEIFHQIGKELSSNFNCGCLGDIRDGPLSLSKKECGK